MIRGRNRILKVSLTKPQALGQTYSAGQQFSAPGIRSLQLGSDSQRVPCQLAFRWGLRCEPPCPTSANLRAQARQTAKLRPFETPNSGSVTTCRGRVRSGWYPSASGRGGCGGCAAATPNHARCWHRRAPGSRRSPSRTGRTTSACSPRCSAPRTRRRAAGNRAVPGPGRRLVRDRGAVGRPPGSCAHAGPRQPLARAGGFHRGGPAHPHHQRHPDRGPPVAVTTRDRPGAGPASASHPYSCAGSP